MKSDRASVFVFGSRVGMSAVGFLATVYFAKTLGPGALGIYFTFEAMLNVLGMFSILGIDSGVEKRISESDSQKSASYLGAALLIVTASLAVISILAIILTDQINGYVGVEAVPALVVGLLFGHASRLALNTIRAEQRVATSALVEFLGEIARVSASVLLYTRGFGPAALLYGLVVGLAFRTLVGVFLVRTDIAFPDTEAIQSLVDFSKYTLGSSVSGLVYNWSDTLILSFMATKVDVGIYESAWKISVVAFMSGQAVGSVLFPAISQWYARGEISKIENAFAEGTLYSTLLVVPAVVGGAMLGGNLMGVVYGYNSGGLILLILLVAAVPQVVSQIASRTMLGINKPRRLFQINAGTTVLNIVLNVVLIYTIGPVGAALATCFVSLTSTSLIIWHLREFIEISIDIRGHAWQLSISLAMGVGVLAVSQIVPTDTLVGLSVAVGTGIVLYGVGIMANKRFRDRLLSLVPI